MPARHTSSYCKLLVGSSTLNVTRSIGKRLQGLHLRLARPSTERVECGSNVCQLRRSENGQGDQGLHIRSGKPLLLGSSPLRGPAGHTVAADAKTSGWAAKQASTSRRSILTPALHFAQVSLQKRRIQKVYSLLCDGRNVRQMRE